MSESVESMEISLSMEKLFESKAERSRILYAELYRDEELLGCVYGKGIDPMFLSDEQKLMRAKRCRRLIDAGAVSGHATYDMYGCPEWSETDYLLVRTSKGAYTLSIGHGKHDSYTEFLVEAEHLAMKMKRLDEISTPSFP